MNPVSHRRQIEDARQSVTWPSTSIPVYQRMQTGKLDPVALGTASAPIDDDVLADCCILLGIIAKTQPERVREFFSLTGSRDHKIAFLLRYGRFEQWRKPV